MKYDAETSNVIPYIAALYRNNFSYRSVVDDLDDLLPAKKTALSGGAYRTYTLGDRSVTRNPLKPDQIVALWDQLMAEKLRLEQNRTKRRTLGVIPRDW